MPDIKLVTIDIDKTLINDELQIPDVNKQAIKQAEEKGCHVVITSGRSGSSVRKMLDELNLHTIVPSLGGCRIEDWDGNVIQDTTISCSDALTILSTAKKYNQDVMVFKQSNWIVDKTNTFWADTEYKITRVPGIMVDIEDYLSKNAPNKMIIPSYDYEVNKKIKKELEDRLGDRVVPIFSSPVYLEFMPVGVNKGTVVDTLIEYYGITKDNALAIGDFYNDIDMFKAAGHSAAVNNAPDDIKQLVEYVSPLTNNQGAVAQILEKYLMSFR